LRGHPIWPWEKFEERTLVEAFPSAQINTWKESIQKYQKGPKNPKIRGAEIIKYLEQEQRLQIPCELRSLIKYIPDARDAVICVFAAIAVTEPKKLVYESDPKFYEFEGWIAVHR